MKGMQVFALFKGMQVRKDDDDDDNDEDDDDDDDDDEDDDDGGNNDNLLRRFHNDSNHRYFFKFIRVHRRSSIHRRCPQQSWTCIQAFSCSDTSFSSVFALDVCFRT